MNRLAWSMLARAFTAVTLLVSLPACQKTVAGPNRAPVAMAGSDRQVSVGTEVFLSGQASLDADGDALHYRWQLLSRPAAARNGLSADDQAEVSLTPDAPGRWIVALSVDDGKLRSERDVLQIRAFRPCASDAECDDGVECTTDTCHASLGCGNTPDPGQCDNGLFCDGAEVCDPVQGCEPGIPPSCADGTACTVDSCNEDSDRCDHLPDDGQCDDGDWCTGTETCLPGQGCQTGSPPCSGATCDAANERCVDCTADADCQNGDYCDGQETCAAGICQAGPAVDCDDQLGCTTDSCDEDADACLNLPDDSLCADADYCNGQEACDPALGCQPGADPCPDQGCDEANDQCVTCTGDDECQNQNICDGDETCQNGDCQAGSVRVAGDYCAGDARVTCDGSGNETDRVICALGCDGASSRCYQVDPSNLDPSLLCVSRSAVTVSSAINLNTDTGSIAGSVTGSVSFTVVTQGNGAPDIGVFSMGSLDVQAYVTVTGNNALAILVCDDVNLASTIDACASNRTAGPGGWGGGATYADGSGFSSGFGRRGNGENGTPWRRTGGGGGAAGGAGGRGGADNGLDGGAGGTANQTAALIPLVGGSGGGGGALANGGEGGGGGGAVQISAGGAIYVEANGGINACGAGGGAAWDDARAGGGGGAGGGILLEAIEVSVDGTLAANGGGGGGGVAYNTSINAGPGENGPYSDDQAPGGSGGSGGGGDGGRGGAAHVPDGAQGQDTAASGGGGGAAGRIRINSRDGGSVGGVVSPNDASGLFTEGGLVTY